MPGSFKLFAFGVIVSIKADQLWLQQVLLTDKNDLTWLLWNSKVNMHVVFQNLFRKTNSPHQDDTGRNFWVQIVMVGWMVGDFCFCKVKKCYCVFFILLKAGKNVFIRGSLSDAMVMRACVWNLSEALHAFKPCRRLQCHHLLNCSSWMYSNFVHSFKDRALPSWSQKAYDLDFIEIDLW